MECSALTADLDAQIPAPFGHLHRNLIDRHPAAWDTHLDAIEFTINKDIRDGQEYSPYCLVYGREPLLPHQLLMSPPGADQLSADPDERYHQLHINSLREAQEIHRLMLQEEFKKNADTYDQGRADHMFAAE